MAGEKGNDVEFENDFDALFELPLAEFTAARNALSARLKKAGRAGEAERVKALAKPSISAWAVNQLYWKHRDAFDRLIAVGESFGRAHASQLAGKAADLREALAARREAIAHLSRLADALLRDAGHNPATDTMRRVATTLEAMSTYASLSDGPRLGRLTADVDPPGFESLAALIPSAGRGERPSQQSRVLPFKTPEKARARAIPDAAKIKSAKAALQAAERSLRETQAKAQGVDAALKKATALSNEAEKEMREVRELLEKARAAADEARKRMSSAAAESKEAAKAVADAERGVEHARKELNEYMK